VIVLIKNTNFITIFRKEKENHQEKFQFMPKFKKVIIKFFRIFR